MALSERSTETRDHLIGTLNDGIKEMETTLPPEFFSAMTAFYAHQKMLLMRAKTDIELGVAIRKLIDRQVQMRHELDPVLRGSGGVRAVCG